MVTINKIGGFNGIARCELNGKSTDKKPIKNVPNGSSFYEIDTGLTYLFDEENSIWHEQ